MKWYRVGCKAAGKAYAVELVAGSDVEALATAHVAMLAHGVARVQALRIEYSRVIENGIIIIRELWD